MHASRAEGDRRLSGRRIGHRISSFEKSTVLAQPDLVSLSAIRKAVEEAGYGVPEKTPAKLAPAGTIGRQIGVLLAVLFLGIAAIAIAGEAFGLFERLNSLLPLPLGIALAVGQWVSAAVVVLFMRIGDAVERFTTERARRAVKELTALAPTTVRVERDGVEQELPPATRSQSARSRLCGRASASRSTAQ